jgi:hypothetical protein
MQALSNKASHEDNLVGDGAITAGCDQSTCRSNMPPPVRFQRVAVRSKSVSNGGHKSVSAAVGESLILNHSTPEVNTRENYNRLVGQQIQEELLQARERRPDEDIVFVSLLVFQGQLSIDARKRRQHAG